MRGIRRHGVTVKRRHERQYRTPIGDIAIFYGLNGNLHRIFFDYRKEGRKAVYIDLGYWGRRAGGRFSGYHKFSINGRHPTPYFRNNPKPPDRFKRFKLKVQSYNKGQDAILLAGMSNKASDVEGFKYLEYERKAVKVLRQHTDREIIYRPKPGRGHASTPIKGTTHSPRAENLEGVLSRCHATVSHHSNVAIDGLIAGVPAFCVEGLAHPMALDDLALIEKPLYPKHREQWLNDIAYCQWAVSEMRVGLAWDYLVSEGLLLNV